MPKVLKKLKRPVQRVDGLKLDGHIATDADGLDASSLKVFDIPFAQLVDHEDNPNTQTEQVFDQVVERIRAEGFDEPIIVYPEIVSGKPTGKYKIASGHHRKKAAELAGMKAVPAVIREGWNEDRALIELTARNHLRGNIDPEKFTQNYNKLKARYGDDQLRRMMGLTSKKQFEVLYKGVKAQLSPKQQRKLEEAKEDIKSVDDLSQVLNEIFRNHGSKLDKSMLVFSFGGKKHIYVQVDKPTMKLVEDLVENCENVDARLGAAFGKILQEADLGKIAKSVKDVDA